MSRMPQVGAAVVAVAVPAGTPMSGYAARVSRSTGVHEPLTVRALVVDRIALVTVDCCALHERTCAEVRGPAVADGAVDDVVLHATHTHSGPCISRERLGEDAPAVRLAVQDAALRAVREAAAARAGCTVSVAERRGVGVAADRRRPDRDIDPPVQAIAFDHAGLRVATLVTYPCHPVVLDAANTLISADFVAPLRARIEDAAGGICVYATGAAGDVNPGRFSPESSFVGGADGRSLADAARIGRRIADAVLAAERHAVVRSASARFRTAAVTLDLDRPDGDAIARDVRAWRAELAAGGERTALLEEWLRWARAGRNGAGRAGRGSTWSGRVSVLALGAARIVCLPGEPFLAASERLRKEHDGAVLVLGYCDGVPGYLPDADAYPHGGYEVGDAHRYYAMPARFALGSLERVLDAASALLGSDR